MKIQLKKFPNGAHIVYEGCEYVKKASILRDHFCLVSTDAIQNRTEPDGSVVPAHCLYLHRDTFVEPLESLVEL